jgi:hypothetical protein
MFQSCGSSDNGKRPVEDTRTATSSNCPSNDEHEREPCYSTDEGSYFKEKEGADEDYLEAKCQRSFGTGLGVLTFDL